MTEWLAINDLQGRMTKKDNKNNSMAIFRANKQMERKAIMYQRLVGSVRAHNDVNRMHDVRIYETDSSEKQQMEDENKDLRTQRIDGRCPEQPKAFRLFLLCQAGRDTSYCRPSTERTN